MGNASASDRKGGSPALGLVEDFRPGETERVERILSLLEALGIRLLRTSVSWADWQTPQGEEWYGWLVPHLAEKVEVLPCIGAPEAPGAAGPRNGSSEPDLYADFVDEVVGRLGPRIEWIELAAEAGEAVLPAAERLKAHGKRALLGGAGAADPRLLRELARAGALAHFDAIGLDAVAGAASEPRSIGAWEAPLRAIEKLLESEGVGAELWITAAGYSTWRNDEFRQLAELAKLLEAPVPRAYWYAAQDLDPDLSYDGSFPRSERRHHLGLLRADGTRKLLARVWEADGIRGVKRLLGLGVSTYGYTRVEQAEIAFSAREASKASKKVPSSAGNRHRPILITGGAGFIGTNLANRLLAEGRSVLILDNLSRPGVERNVGELCARNPQRANLVVADIRDRYAVREAVRDAAQVFHFAAQVAVTTSIEDPATDLEVNVEGTLNLLEAARRLSPPPPLVFTSTNKVYGNLTDIPLESDGSRYRPGIEELSRCGIDEARPLDFHSPYGCSKGAADQYVLDYARVHGLPTAVFRMSCIYGPHQLGTEDQGWVGHFLLQTIHGRPLTIYGDGLQVRDILYVDDLVDALLLAQSALPSIAGRAFNIGGGPANTVSLLEMIAFLTRIQGRAPEVRFGPWRQGDQRYYVSDSRAFSQATGWVPRVGVEEGLKRFFRWLEEHHPVRRAVEPSRGNGAHDGGTAHRKPAAEPVGARKASGAPAARTKGMVSKGARRHA